MPTGEALLARGTDRHDRHRHADQLLEPVHVRARLFGRSSNDVALDDLLPQPSSSS